ncbi:MAG TPA: hypothetical protein VFD92_16350 [Candidatus Binatia bacterium]|nr:hypothetical protein [Candidatus Binatia bacterium]
MSLVVPSFLARLAEPFDHPDWLFELKYDGLRATAVLAAGKVRLLSRRADGHVQFAELCAALPGAIRAARATIDGEIVCLDDAGRPVFDDLIERRGRPAFVAFDLIALDDEDLRPLPLLERKRKLRRIIPQRSGCLFYADHFEGRGVELFRWACENDFEGIVAKRKRARYRATPKSSWIKIANPRYSQAAGRPEHPAGPRKAVARVQIDDGR